jgi:hypothetical protein
MMKLIKTLFLQIALSITLLEVVARIGDPIGISYYPQTARLLDNLMIKEEPIGYRLRPGARGHYHGAEVKINSLGLRNDEIPAKKEPNEIRLLLMGDSVPFGMGVEQDEIISHELELILNSHPKDSSAPSYRVINMGVPSYNSEQELVQLQMLGERLQPDIVVLLYSLNDIEPKMWVFEKRDSIWANLAQRSYAASLLFVSYREVRSMLRPKSAKKDSGINIGEYRQDSPRWQSVDYSLSALNQLAKSLNSKFILITQGAAKGEYAYKLLNEVAAREGFVLGSLHLTQFEAYKNSPRDFLNSYIDSHPNKKGTKLYAKGIEQLIVPFLKTD